MSVESMTEDEFSMGVLVKLNLGGGKEFSPGHKKKNAFKSFQNKILPSDQPEKEGLR